MNIDISLYKHFSFDLWMTLIKSNPEFKHKRDAMFRDFFEIKENQVKISQTIRKYDLLCNAISEKTGKHIGFYEIYFYILKELNIDINLICLKKLDKFYDNVEQLFFQKILYG